MTDVQRVQRIDGNHLLRRVVITILTGALLGLLVGGIFGRLAMYLLAQLNSSATGVLSDDGFAMGHFTVAGTLNLLAVTTVIGALGGAIYLALRTLRIGPRWFQLTAVTVGPGVVVSSMLVHDGVDFTLLQPASLAIAIFVAIPALYGLLLMVLTDRWLGSDDHPAYADRPILWVGRIVLALMFLMGLADLIGDINQFA